MDIEWCEECKAFHPIKAKDDIMYFDNPEDLV